MITDAVAQEAGFGKKKQGFELWDNTPISTTVIIHITVFHTLTRKGTTSHKEHAQKTPHLYLDNKHLKKKSKCSQFFRLLFLASSHDIFGQSKQSNI